MPAEAPLRLPLPQPLVALLVPPADVDLTRFRNRQDPRLTIHKHVVNSETRDKIRANAGKEGPDRIRLSKWHVKW